MTTKNKGKCRNIMMNSQERNVKDFYTIEMESGGFKTLHF